MEPSILDYYNDYPSMIKIIDALNEENNRLQDELYSTKGKLHSTKGKLDSIKDELEFYKSIFKTHRNSVVYNLYIKYKDKQRLWIDKIRTDKYELQQLDEDKDIIEWLKPVRCER
jgi:predicted RNase H-like nuclease (RuvC/YqgF family)